MKKIQGNNVAEIKKIQGNFSKTAWFVVQLNDKKRADGIRRRLPKQNIVKRKSFSA